MSAQKEMWISAGDKPALKTGEPSTIVLRGKPKIHFIRGSNPQTVLSAYGVEPLRLEYDSPVVSPVPKAVAELWKKTGITPSESNLIRIVVDPGVVTEPKAKLKAGSKTVAFDLEKTEDGVGSKDMLLFVYGEGSVGEKDFPGIQVVDVTKSGPEGFETTVEFEAGPDKRKLGLIDVLIKDPADGKYRTARYGIFKARTPEAKLVCPRIGANNIQVFLDDGSDQTDDRINITALANPSGDVTDVQLPLAIAPDDARVIADWSPDALRSRELRVPPEPGLTLALFLLGENRITIKDAYSGSVVMVASFFLYASDEDTVPGTLAGESTVEGLEGGGGEHKVAKDAMLLTFKDSATGPGMSAALHAFGLRPRGYSPHIKLVQAHVYPSRSGAGLKDLAQAITDQHLPDLDSVDLDFLDTESASPSTVLERLPPAFRTGAEFNAVTGTFTNALNDYFHHFYMHTFAAHRLIDRIRFPEADPPSVSLEGSHFETNKSFLLPTGRASVMAVFQGRQDFPQRKLAVFGHADATGSDAHNNALTQFRAQTAHALLLKDPDVWLRRLDGTPVVTESPWGNREIQFMLKSLGHYNGNIDGVYNPATRTAAKAWLGTTPLPVTADGSLDRAARRRLIAAYMDHLLPTALVAGDFFRDGAGQTALWGCGKAFPLIASDPANGQNRRVTFVLRITEPVPIVLGVQGAAVPYRQWISPEAEAAAHTEDNPPFTLGCWDSGFGRGDDFRNTALNAQNRLFIKGRRIVRPTKLGAAAVNDQVFTDGDLRLLSDDVGPLGTGLTHGSGVMTSMTGDGVGNEVGGARNAQQVVLGTGKDVKIRPITRGGSFTEKIRGYEILTADRDVKIVSTSFLGTNIPGNSAVQQNQLMLRIQALVNSGKIFFLAAGNAGVAVQRDVARTEGGFFGPNRNNPRSTNTGAQAFRQRVASVGATSHVATPGDPELPTNFTYLGDEVSMAAPGEDIRLVLPQVNGPTLPNAAFPAGASQVVDNVAIQNWSGTSFATPMTAGVAAEMMMVNPRLQQNANIVQVLEMLEATADALPDLAAGTAAQQGPFLPGMAPADPQLAAADLRGYRRIHFWKAILAALNEGLPAETMPPGAANHPHFTFLLPRDHAATVWYGFEVRVALPGARLWFKRADGTFRPIEDGGAALPGDQTLGMTWRKAQDLTAPVTHANVGFRGFVLPAFPFPAAPWFLAQVSVMREELARFAEIRVYPGDVDPASAANVPALSVLDLAQINRMRAPTAITPPEIAGTPALARIAAHVEVFSNFVFHWTVRPQALQAFILVHPGAANAQEDITVRIFAVDPLGNFKSDLPATTVNIRHTGTNGVSPPPAARGLFINGNPAGASTPINLVNGRATFTLRNHTVENFRISATDGAGHNDDGTGPEIHVGPPGATASFRVEVSHFDNRSVDANPPRTAERLKYTVTALDGEGRTKTDFIGRVELQVTEGTMGSDVAGGVAPFKRGVHVSDATADAFSAARFAHDFVAGDHGKFEFSVFHYSTGPVVIQAGSGGNTGDSPRLTIKGGPLDHFNFSHPPSARVGNRLDLDVSARDHFDNIIEDFAGQVDFTAQPGAMTAGNAAGSRTGVYILETESLTDDHYVFSATDHGAHTIPVTPYTAGNFQIRAVSGAVTSDTPQIAAEGAAALNSFAFTVHNAQRSGLLFPVTVRALDVEGNLIPSFAGNVTLARVSGPAAAPNLIAQVFGAADNGQFTFDLRATGVGSLLLRASSGTIHTDSSPINIS